MGRVELWSEVLLGSSPFLINCEVIKPLGTSVSSPEKRNGTHHRIPESLLVSRASVGEGPPASSIIFLLNKNSISVKGHLIRAFGTTVFSVEFWDASSYAWHQFPEPQFPFIEGRSEGLALGGA